MISVSGSGLSPNVYVHIGGDQVIPIREVVAILDARLLEKSVINHALVAKASREKKLKGIGLDPQCRAVVVASGGVYTSAISAPTLARRLMRFSNATLVGR